MTELLVKDLADSVVADGTRAPFGGNRERALWTNSREGLVDLWTRAGKVFSACNPVQGQPETMSANGTAVTLTAPSLRYTVPSGLVVCPIHVQFSVGQVTAKNNILAIIVSDTDTYTSGGDAVLMTARNSLIQSNAAPKSSQVTNLHYSDTAIVEGTLTRPRMLKTLRSEGLSDAPVTPSDFEYNILKGDQMVYIEGPGSFLVYLVQETTAAEAEWSMSWAELDATAFG